MKLILNYIKSLLVGILKLRELQRTELQGVDAKTLHQILYSLLLDISWVDGCRFQVLKPSFSSFPFLSSMLSIFTKTTTNGAVDIPVK